MNDLTRRKNFVINITKKAGSFVASKFYETTRIEFQSKSKHEILTPIDLKAESMILDEIKSNFYGDSILSEEAGIDDQDSEFMWIVDPIDGTTNFFIGNPVFTTSIALVYKGEIILGATYHPILNQIFYVEKGKGFYLNGEKQTVSSIEKLEDAFVAFCHGSDPITIKKIVEVYSKLKPLVKALRQLGAASFELALIASGKIDAFLMPGVKAWDVATGVLMVTEAGGEAIDFTGKKWSLKSKDLLACNSQLKEKINKLL